MVNGFVVRLPLVGWEPTQPLEALQLVALVDVQVNFAVHMYAYVIGESELLALISTVGAGGGVLTSKVIFIQ